MANWTNVTVVTGANNDVAAAGAALDTAISAIDTAKTIFLCDVYKVGVHWHHLLIHQT